MSVIEYTGYFVILFLAIKIGLPVASWIYRKYLSSSLDVTKCGGKWAGE